MDFAFISPSISTRRNLTSILLAVAIFATLAGLASRANGRPGIFAILNAIFVGTAVGFFEEFYVQSLRGRWIRNIHPLRAILIYTVIVVVFFLPDRGPWRRGRGQRARRYEAGHRRLWQHNQYRGPDGGGGKGAQRFLRRLRRCRSSALRAGRTAAADRTRKSERYF